MNAFNQSTRIIIFIIFFLFLLLPSFDLQDNRYSISEENQRLPDSRSPTFFYLHINISYWCSCNYRLSLSLRTWNVQLTWKGEEKLEKFEIMRWVSSGDDDDVMDVFISIACFLSVWHECISLRIVLLALSTLTRSMNCSFVQLRAIASKCKSVD